MKSKTANWSVILMSAGVAAAAGCGGSDGGSGPPCRVDNCGSESFRRAVPTRADALIDFPGARSSSSLDAVSDRFAWTEQTVDSLNGAIDDVFLVFEDAVGGAPEIAEDDVHQWRTQVGGLDGVLRLEAAGGDQYAITYRLGAPGTETAPTVLTGMVEDEAFEVTVDYDALTEAAPATNATGDIVLRCQPFSGGETEVWYDFHQFAVGSDPIEDSRLTYWEFGGDSSAIELVGETGGFEAVAYVRWDADGGRYDHHLDFLDGTDEVASNCWTGSGSEVFDAWAESQPDGSWYAEIDGDEASCDFGPVADHPMLTDEFDGLPGEGEWDDL